MPLRDRIGLAVYAAFERTYKAHGISFDPDTCDKAADEVIALLISELTGQEWSAKFHPTIIGPAEFVAGASRG